MSLAAFKSKLKTYLFSHSQWLMMATRRCCGFFSWFWCRDINDFTYLLTCLLPSILSDVDHSIFCRRLALAWTIFFGHISAVVHSMSVIVACIMDHHLSSSSAGFCNAQSSAQSCSSCIVVISQRWLSNIVFAHISTQMICKYMALAHSLPHMTFGSISWRAQIMYTTGCNPAVFS